MGWNLNDLAVVNSPVSFYHGLTGTVLEIGPYGVILTFTEQECDRVSDRRRVIHDRPTPFSLETIVRPGEPLSQKTPILNEPAGPLPHEICGCGVFGPPCGSCGHCQHCNTRIKGEFCDTHAWRHYYGSQEHKEVLEILSRERTASNPGESIARGLEQAISWAAGEEMPVKPRVITVQVQPKENKPAGQVSLWD